MINSSTSLNTPRRSRFCVRSRKNRSTMFSQDALVGRRLRVSPCGAWREHVILFAQTFLSTFDGDFMITGEGFDPIAVIVGSLAQHVFAHDWNAQNLVDEMDYLLGTGQSAEVAVDDDAIEAVVYKDQQAGKQLCEKFHRLSVLRSCLDNSI